MKLQKIFTTLALVAGLGFATSATTAEAAVFDFSYKFLTNTTLSGSIEGDLQSDGDTVLNLRNLSAKYSAEPGIILTFTESIFSSNPQISLTGANLRFLGFEKDANTLDEQSNFGFLLFDDVFLNSATVGTFWTSTNSGTTPAATGDEREAEVYSATRWLLKQRPNQVPEPSTIGAIVLAGLFGATLKRKISSKQS